jgi:uncharacterized protein (DUF2141 family)
MKRIILFLIIQTAISSACFSQFKLDIEVTDISNNKGNIMLQLFDSTQNVIKEEMSQIKDKKCIITIDNLIAGRYAVRYYHDENADGKMETNLVGKPTEGYGFSNNVIGKFGPPAFEKWLFRIDSDKKIILKPTY